ncbi:MAG: bifunctional DNA primase/polymerase [Terracidiphilus sp.]|jgi:hypothetical protein
MTISAERFLLDFKLRARNIHALQTPNCQPNSVELPQAIRDAAMGRKWRIFPVTTGSLRAPAANALIRDATSDISALEEQLALYPGCQYGLATGPESGVWAIEFDGGWNAAALYGLAGIVMSCADDHLDGITLLSREGSKTYAFFKWPLGLGMQRSCINQVPGLRIHGDGSWVPLPPSEFSGGRCEYVNDEAVTETPDLLVNLVFKAQGAGSGLAGPPKYPPQPVFSGSLPFRNQHGNFSENQTRREKPYLSRRRGIFLVSRRR